MNRYIGDRIRRAREQFGISQKALGDLLGISDKAISTYESGRTLPPLDILIRISSILKKDAWYFLEENEEHVVLLDKIEHATELLKEANKELIDIKKYIEDKNSEDLVPPNLPV